MKHRTILSLSAEDIEKTLPMSDADEAEAFAREKSDRLAIPVAAEAVERALSDCDVICTATPATRPVFSDQLLKPGVHINAVGSCDPQMCEIPPETVARARDRSLTLASRPELGENQACNGVSA